MQTNLQLSRGGQSPPLPKPCVLRSRHFPQAALDQADGIVHRLIAQILIRIRVPQNAQAGHKFVVAVPELNSDAKILKKRQGKAQICSRYRRTVEAQADAAQPLRLPVVQQFQFCLLYTSDAADD